MTGFWRLDVSGVPPSKVHSQEVGLYKDTSENCTDPPSNICVMSAEKSATGAKGGGIQLMLADHPDSVTEPSEWKRKVRAPSSFVAATSPGEFVPQYSPIKGPVILLPSYIFNQS